MTQFPPKPVLFFDGVCNLCNSWVNFVIDRDPEARILFAPLQSEISRSLLLQFDMDADAMDTVVLLDQGRLYERSDAVLQLVGYLGGPVRLIRAGVLVPRFLRDAVYNYIAKKRYRWFGKRDECRVPEPGLKNRFLDMN